MTNKRARLTLMAVEGVPLTREWETAVSALEAGNAQLLLALPIWEREFLELEIPGVAEKLRKIAPIK